MADEVELPQDTETDQQEPPARPQTNRKLSFRQQGFIQNYTNPDNPDTFGNGVQSVLAIPGRKGTSYDGASKQAMQYLQNPRIQSEIESQAEAIGIGSRFRLSTLHLIATGQYETRARKDKKGRVYRTPKAAEVVKAIEVANKMVGLYEKNRVQMNALSSRFRELARQYKPSDRAIPVEHKSIHVKAKSPLCFGLYPMLPARTTKQASTQLQPSTA